MRSGYDVQGQESLEATLASAGLHNTRAPMLLARPTMKQIMTGGVLTPLCIVRRQMCL